MKSQSITRLFMAPEIMKSCPLPQLFKYFRNFPYPDNELSTSDP